jgi:3'-5' exonuclease
VEKIFAEGVKNKPQTHHAAVFLPAQLTRNMTILNLYDQHNILFLDIETVPGQMILKKQEDELEFDEIAETYAQRAGIYSEYGKIVCLTIGYLVRPQDGSPTVLRLKSFTNHNEAFLLQDFADLLNKYYNNPDKFAFCGHNIKEFDIPYICRRMMIGGVELPRMLDISGKKPWETKHLIDTLELWKFGDMKNYTSLNLLTHVFGIPSPKDDMDGSDVAGVYWNDRDLDRIAQYCEKDVVATVQLFLKFKRLPLLDDSQVVIVR